MKEKIKRISSSTWALLLALMMVVSSFSVLAATTNVNKTGASLNSGETIYLKPNSLWLSDNAKFGLYVWNDNQTGHWVIMNDDDRDGYYSASVPSGGPYAKVIFLRLKDTTSELSGEDWPSSYIWNQTADLIREDGKNCYAVTEGTWDKGGGTWSTYSASKGPVATSVSLSSNATDGKITQGNDLILTANATGKVDGDVTYTFYNGGTQVGQAQTTTENTATTTVSGLSAGDYKFTVKVTKDGYTSVTGTVQVKVVAPAKEMYLYGDFDSNADHMWNANFKDYKFEYVNGKYILKNVPFTGSVGGKEPDYAFFRIYVSDDEQYSSTTEADQELNNGVTAKIRVYNDKALKFKVPTSKRVNIEFDLEKLQITVTEVVVNCKMNAKYQISDTGSSFQDAKTDKNIATVNDDLTATGSTGLVKAVNSFEADGNTYVFSKWVSESGTFANATSNQTTFSPTSDGDVIAQYKRQYMVTCTTPTNGTLTASATGPLAGDSYTVTVKPVDGYELASLMVYLGTPETSGNDITSRVVNGTYTTTALNNARYVATFTKKEVDYSKYRLCGHFDNSEKWTYDSGIEFDKNGKATFTVTDTSGGSGQFLICDSSKVKYGSNVQDGQVVDYTTTYTTTKGNGYVYYVQYAGTYVVEIVNIDSNGVPKFKVTKVTNDDTNSNYQLYISKGKNAVGTLLGNFTKAKDGTTYQYIITVDAGTHYFYIKDSLNTDSNVQYSQGGENRELGTPYLMNKRNNVENIQYKLSAGSYKVTYSDINDNGEGQFKIVSLSKPLAESVDLSPSTTAVKTNNNVTLTAKINNKRVEDGAYYTYTFYDGEGKQVGEKETTELTASCETTSSTEGVVSYKVVVSTKATYTDPDYPTVNLTYTDISSKTIQVDYREKFLYIAEVKDGKLGKLYQLTADSFKPADGAQSVTIAVFSDETISDDTVCNLTVSESKNKYTTITSSTIDTDDVAGIPTYTINCNEGASSPTIHIVDDNIYAVATFDMGATNTFGNTNTVDYYFAEPTDKDGTGISNPTTGDGLRIYYWNNSVATQCGYADVTTKVDQYGKDSGSNTITVNMGDLYSSGVKGSKTFNVYKVSLPVWATSFKFVSSGKTEIKTFSTFVPNAAGDASIGLNPNRIYLLYKNGPSYYSRGVVLDSSFWTKTSSENNDVPTKNFKANAVNYNTQYDKGGNVTNTFNTNLNALYDTAYANPLFFGYVDPATTEVAGNQNFRIQDNLAMRHDDNHAYYASVQGLAGNTLSSTSKNKNGCGYLLTADGSGNMPLFDYDKLKLESNSNVASNVYEGLNFPFNESTFNGITTYSYDSFTDKNRVIDVDGDFKVDKYSNATVGNDNGVGFFPFDNTTPTYNANKYGFGTEFDIDFYMSETGKLTAADGTQKDITFNFSGDDDVWVYVDGVLVLDLGGAHKVSSGSINFSTMKVIYKAAVDSSDNINNRTAVPKTNDKYATDEKYVTTVDLAKIFKANGAEFNNKNSSKKHTLQMFYMERGSFDSNCSISFNLPQNTGLLVRNDVNFDSVNPGLKEATMGIANKDYFSYMIENKYASDAEFTKLTGKYVTLPNKTTSDIIKNNGNFTFGTSNPLYPIVTTDNIIRRVVNGTTYYLAVKNTSGDSCQSYWSTLLEDAYKGLPSINFSLPDDFAKLENSTDENNSTAVSGQTDTNGGFNLLFNQSAKFNSKIPSNTMVKVVQNETLYEVNAGDSNTAMSVASDANGKVTRRNVSNFYSTSYKITDDKSQKVITEAKGNKDSNVFSNDTSAGTDGFYFADYSENHSDSSAMTVNFTNTVSTSDIKIIKKVTTDNSDNRVDPKSGDRFTFTVKLSNIFGDKDDTTLKEYENLTYKVYDSTGKLEGTRTYGESGVSITANEYAVITGIPVGTHYEVTEKQRTGYQFDNVTGEFVATTLNSTKAATQTNEIKDTDFISCNDSVDSTISTNAKTVTGNMPIANDANNAGKTVQLTYTNKEAGFTITFKYYDREVKTGTVAHINTKPTVVNYVFSVSDLVEYQNQDGTYDYARMITKAVTAGGIDPDNVIDSYKYFTSQDDALTGAVTGIKKEYSYRNYDEANSKYLTYGEAYPEGSNFANHTDCYGRLQGSDGAAVSDGEDWVSYYNGKTKYKTEDDAKKANASVTSITVWFFNNLKSYKPTFHYATAKNELSPIDGTSKFVGIQTNTIKPVFYNVRLGVANGVDSIDAEGIYLKEYGVTGYTGTYSGTAMSIQNGETELKFLYWSYDKAGKSIASNSYKYGYRVTNNIHLYAIYGEAKDNTEPGLTVSMNSPDYHKDSNGIDRVRLNTVMNVYNCPDDDPNIKNVAVIYILDPNNYIQDYINKDNKTALENIRKNVYDLIKANGSKAQFSGVTIKIDGENDNKALGLTYTASKDLLTNKNRVQFTTDFKQSALAAQKVIYTFSAMNYSKESATDWIVSDNCIKYIFDKDGKVTGDSTQVNCLQ